ncbi:hypothetical protein Tco_0606401 [Tanacetum coccineum]
MLALVRRCGLGDRGHCPNKMKLVIKMKSSNGRIMPPKSAPLTQAVVWRMIKESVDAAIAAERARHANAGNNGSRSGQARGQVTTSVVRECTFAGFIKCNPDNFRGTECHTPPRRKREA